MFTPEDEIDVLHHDLGQARRRLFHLEYAELEHRVTDKAWHELSLQQARRLVQRLERELGEALAARRAADEAYERTL